jgi:hypothetical protein
VADLILPDNRRPGPLPVFFEGRLRRFDRRIGLARISHAHRDGAPRALRNHWKCGLDRTAPAHREGNTVNWLSSRNLPLLSGPYAPLRPEKTR